MRPSTIKGSVMFLCKDLRSCHLVTVNWTQPSSLQTYLLLKVVQQRPCDWVGEVLPSVTGNVQRVQKLADAKEMDTNFQHSDKY